MCFLINGRGRDTRPTRRPSVRPRMFFAKSHVTPDNVESDGALGVSHPRMAAHILLGTVSIESGIVFQYY